MAQHPEARAEEGILVLRPEAPLFFGNADPVFERALRDVAQAPDAQLVILSLEESPDLDGTVLEALGGFVQAATRRGVAVRCARTKDLALQALARTEIAERIGWDTAGWSVADVIAAWRDRGRDRLGSPQGEAQAAALLTDSR
jgi:sulfate permease, SulP family